MENLSEENQISPDYVRISMAAAIELGLKPGQISGCRCNCINLLQNYPQGCYANCTYCGLARERPGLQRTIPSSVLPGPSFPPTWLQKKSENWKKVRGSAEFVSPRSRIIGRTGT